MHAIVPIFAADEYVAQQFCEEVTDIMVAGMVL